MKDQIKYIVKKVRKTNCSTEELEQLFDTTTSLLEQIGDLRSKGYTKEQRCEYSRYKSALWSIRNSIRYRLGITPKQLNSLL